MSKINQNKIIGFIFLAIFVVLILLSLQKFQQAQDQAENISFQDDPIVEILEIVEEKENKIVTSLEERVMQGDYGFELVIEGDKILHSFDEGENLFEVMTEMQDLQKLTFKSKDFSGLGSYIYSINNISEDRGKGLYWIYYVNGKKANVGVSNYVLKEDDQIKWQLESNTY